jgi:hypothetical protein
MTTTAASTASNDRPRASSDTQPAAPTPPARRAAPGAVNTVGRSSACRRAGRRGGRAGEVPVFG